MKQSWNLGTKTYEYEYDDISALEEWIVSVEGWMWSQPEEVRGASHMKCTVLKRD